MSKVSLVMLPGLATDARLWQPQIDGLAGVASTWVADLTGGGSMTAMAASVLANAPSERFALAGLSMGGYTAFEVVRQAPERVVALALLDTSARPDTPEASENRRNLMRLAETDFAAVVDALLPKLVHPHHLADPAMGGVAASMAHSIGKEAFLRQQTAIMGRPDSRPLLAQIKCPALVLCGREDALTPLELHEEMAAGIPGSKLTVIDVCGHLSTLEQPQQVNEAMRRWLSCIASGSL